MYDTILKNWLQRQLRNPAVHDLFIFIRIIFYMKLQSVTKSIFLYSEIGFAVVQFFLHRYKVLYLCNSIAKKFRQCFSHICHTVKSCDQCFSPDTLQCIVQEMWVDLILQCKILCLSLIQIHQFRRIEKFLHEFHLFGSIRYQKCCLRCISFRNQISFQKSFYDLFRITVRFYDPEPSCQTVGQPENPSQYCRPQRDLFPHIFPDRQQKHYCYHSKYK